MISKLGQIASKLTVIGTLEELAVTVEELLATLLPVEYSALYLFDESVGRLRLISAIGFTEEERREAEKTAMDRHPGHVYRTKSMLYIPDVERDKSRRSTSSRRSFVVGSRLFLPVMLGAECVGTLGILGSEPKEYSEEEISTLSFVANLTAVVYDWLRKQEESKKTESELRLRNHAITSSNNGIIITDAKLPDNPVIYVNPAFEKITGYSSGEVIGKNLRFLHGSENDQKGLNVLREALAIRRSCQVVLRNYRKDTTPFWSELRISPVFDSTGSVTHYVGIQADVTDRIVADKRLRTAAARLARLIENLQAGILVEDANRRIALVNANFCAMFGIPASPVSLLGADCSQAAQESQHLFVDPDAFTNRVLDILRQRKVVVGEVLELVDGRFFERDYIPIEIEKEYLGHLWQYRDITTRLEAQRAVELSAERRKELILIAQSLIATLSEEEICTILPESVSRITSFERLTLHSVDRETRVLRRRILKDTRGRSAPIDPEELSLDSVIAEPPEGLFEAERINNAENDRRAMLFSGGTRAVKHMMLFPVTAGSELAGIMTIARYDGEAFTMEEFEVTHSLVTYVSLALENARLFERIRKNQEELRRAKQIADESMEVREQFFARMSHEIRTPLNGVVGFTHLLQQTSLSRKQHEFVTYLQHSAESLLVIVNDILDLAKLAAGKLEISEKKFSLNDVLDSVIESVRQRAKEKHIEVSLGTDPDIPTRVVGDPVRLSQILMNIMTNAVKFTDQGTVRLFCTMVQSQRDRTLIEFRCEDTGIGIHADKLPFLFQSYSQVHDSGSQNYGGTGLGLAITKHLVEMQNGTVQIQSEPNVGTTVTVHIPFATAEPEAAKPESVSPEVGAHLPAGKRMLVVDDNEMNRLVISTILRNWGMAVEEAGSGREAINILRSGGIDLVLMDLSMPDVDGFAVTQSVRTELPPPLSTVPIIALTATLSADVEMKCIESGMNDFLMKPFKPDVLRGVLQRLLTEHPAQPEQPVDSEAVSTDLDPEQIDLSYFKEIGQGEPAFVEKALGVFLTTTRDSLERFAAAGASGDIETLRSTAHALKPLCAMVGLHALSEQCATIENEAQTGGTISRELIDRVIGSLRHVVSVVQEMHAGGTGKAGRN